MSFSIFYPRVNIDTMPVFVLTLKKPFIHVAWVFLNIGIISSLQCVFRPLDGIQSRSLMFLDFRASLDPCH